MRTPGGARVRRVPAAGVAGPVSTGPPDSVGRVAGLDTRGRVVPVELSDYNGHRMDAYYSAAFTEATVALLDHVGLGAAYHAGTGCGIYTAETYLCFSGSVAAGGRLHYFSQLLGCDEKRLHVFHRMTE
jgi:acyl-CoA thioesterase FadM